MVSEIILMFILAVLIVFFYFLFKKKKKKKNARSLSSSFTIKTETSKYSFISIFTAKLPKG